MNRLRSDGSGWRVRISLHLFGTIYNRIFFFYRHKLPDVVKPRQLRVSAEEMRYDAKDSSLKLVQKPDAITGNDDAGALRVEMSCGHAVDPISLTEWCRSLIHQGHFKFHCPALRDGTNEDCNKEWSYLEVRRHALLSGEEQQFFEEKLANLAAAKYCEYKQCPRCDSCVERKDLTDISVNCSICTANDGIPFEFCWQCLREWKGPAPRSDRCDNEGCTNIQLDALKNCGTKVLRYSHIQKCPKIRACPTCGLLIEHKDMCKYVQCIRCHVKFCFACLMTEAICRETSDYSTGCARPVAPKQTSIPVWNSNLNQTSNPTSNSHSLSNTILIPDFTLLSLSSPILNSSRNPIQNPVRNPIQNPVRNPLQNPVRNPLQNPVRNPNLNPHLNSGRRSKKLCCTVQ